MRENEMIQRELNLMKERIRVALIDKCISKFAADDLLASIKIIEDQLKNCAGE